MEKITSCNWPAILMLALLALARPLAAGIPDQEPADRMPYVLPGDGVMFMSIVRDGRLIWDLARVPDRDETNLEFPCLIRFKDRWYCSFREGDRHGNDPSGRARVIRSRDGESWETAALFEWQGGDVRDPRMSVTSDGKLMVHAAVYFIGEPKAQPAAWEQPGKRQSVTWLSDDGVNWSEAYACPTGFDTWRWDVAWHAGYGYSVGYAGKDRRGTLYRTADGRTWEVLVENFFPPGGGTEAAMGFGADGTGYCLLRGGSFYGMFAVGRPEDYRHWEWHSMLIDAAGNGETESGAAFGRRTRSIVGGQSLLRLRDGRIVAVTAKGGVDLFWVEPENALFTRFMRMSDCMSYPGVVEYDGELWLTNSQRAPGFRGVKSGIYLIRIKPPPPASVENLMEVAGKVLQAECSGFAISCREQLVAVVRDVADARPADGRLAADRERALRKRLLKALGDYRAARELHQAVRSALAAADTALQDDIAGFGYVWHEKLRAQRDALVGIAADTRAKIADVRALVDGMRKVAHDFEQALDLRAGAERLLAEVAALADEPFTGFARVYRNQAVGRSESLRAALHDPRLTVPELLAAVEDLRAMAADLRAVDSEAPLRVDRIEHMPGSHVLAGAEAWSDGALMNVTVVDGALMPAQKPLLSFSDETRTMVRVENPRVIADLKAAFTLSAWGFPKADESYRTLIDKGGRDAAFAIRQARSVGNDNHVSVRLYMEGEPHPHEPYAVAYAPENPAEFDGRWHHYACTYDGNILRFYVDGHLKGTLEKRGHADFSEGDLCFGSLATGREYWQGYIKKVAVWSRPLAEQELGGRAQRSLRGDEDGLVGYWPLDDGAGDMARDLTAYGNHGHVRGGVWKTRPVRMGYRISHPILLEQAQTTNAAVIEWVAEVDADSDQAGVRILYGMSDSPEALPDEWRNAVNGALIPEISGGHDRGSVYVWLKQVLTTENPSVQARLSRLTFSIVGNGQKPSL